MSVAQMDADVKDVKMCMDEKEVRFLDYIAILF